MLGFWGKMYVFLAAGAAGLWWLVFLGAVLAVVALYYYLNIACAMFIVRDEGPRVSPAVTIMLVVLLCALVVVGAGLYPGPFVEMAEAAAAAL